VGVAVIDLPVSVTSVTYSVRAFSLRSRNSNTLLGTSSPSSDNASTDSPTRRSFISFFSPPLVVTTLSPGKQPMVLVLIFVSEKTKRNRKRLN
jgi:hypothetical protein